jgi:hypothetical protein
MSVIINEFEIVTSAEPAPRGPERGTGKDGGAAQPPLRPQDVERIVRHQHQRRERLRAD